MYGAGLSLNPHWHGTPRIAANNLSSVKNDGRRQKDGIDRKRFAASKTVGSCVSLVACRRAPRFSSIRQFLLEKDYNGKFNNSFIFK